MRDFEETINSLPAEVRQGIMDNFHRMLTYRGYVDAWRLGMYDGLIEEIVEALAENGVDILEIS